MVRTGRYHTTWNKSEGKGQLLDYHTYLCYLKLQIKGIVWNPWTWIINSLPGKDYGLTGEKEEVE